MAKPPAIKVPVLSTRQLYLMSVPGSKNVEQVVLAKEGELSGVQTVKFGEATRTVEQMASIGATFTPLVALTAELYANISLCAAAAEASENRGDRSAAKAVNKWLAKMPQPETDD